MSKSFIRNARRPVRPPFWRFAGLTLLVLALAWRVSAQNVTITSASFAQLQAALNYSSTTVTRTVYCEFDGTITVTTPLFVTGNIFLVAPTNFNVTIAGSPGVRLFEVLSNATFVVENLVISGGSSAGTNGIVGTAGTSQNPDGAAGTAGASGGAGSGGAIYNLGTNYAYNCLFLTNNATGGVGGAGGAGGNGSERGGNGGSGGNGGAALGGAIYNLGLLVLSNCTFSGNEAIGANGGVGGTNGTGGFAYPGAGGTGGAAQGAGVYNLGRANIQACTFEFNFVQGGNSQTAGGTPGGNGNGPNGPPGGWGLGGGVYNSGTNVIMVNCTFAGNLAVGGNGGNGGPGINSGYDAGAGGNGGNGSGGGLYNDVGGILMVTNCTFANGSVFGGTNGSFGTVGSPKGNNGTMGLEEGANIASAGTFYLKNSILAYPTNGGNAYGTFTDEGFNISSDHTPSIIASTTLTNTDPLLLPLGTNGGPTATFDLEPELSPALHAISDGKFPPFDQRGYPRPNPGPNADIGSVESGTPSFTLSGYILPAGSNYTNVVINAQGSGLTYSTSPTATGFYYFSNTLPADTYIITPQATNGFSFNPLSLTVTLADTNATSVSNDFVATASYMIGGVISNLTGTATVFIYATTNGDNTFFQQTTTSNNGLYTFTNVPVGGFTIIPQQTTATAFNPGSLFLNVSGNNTNNNFFAVPPTYSVSGQITGGSGTFTVFATIGTTSTLFASTQTDNEGNYSFGSLSTGSYTITPQPTNGLTFTPINIFITVPPSTNSQDFSAQGTASYSIVGQITNLHAVVSLSASSSSLNTSTNTDANGNYAFTGLPADTYTITPAAVSGLTFRPANLSVTVGPSIASQFFAAIPSAQPTNSAPHFSNQTFVFSVDGYSNLTYRIQASTNLTTWTDISTNTTSAGGVITVSNSTTGFSNRFFRAVTP